MDHLIINALNVQMGSSYLSHHVLIVVVQDHSRTSPHKLVINVVILVLNVVVLQFVPHAPSTLYSREINVYHHV